MLTIFDTTLKALPNGMVIFKKKLASSEKVLTKNARQKIELIQKIERSGDYKMLESIESFEKLKLWRKFKVSRKVWG